MKGFKYLFLALAVSSIVACASAEQKLANKQSYRNAQIQAIKVQKDSQVNSVEAQSAERIAMWNALSEAVKANPESAHNLAIVAAVASTSSGNGSGSSVRGNVVTLNTERDSTGLDYVKAITPALVGGLTQVGITALTTDYQKEAIKQNTKVRMVEAEQDGKVWDVLTAGFGAAGDSNQINIIGGGTEYADQAAENTTTDVFGLPVDDGAGPPADEEPPVDVVDDPPVEEPPVVEDDDDADPDDVTDEEPDEEPINCDEPQFSPSPCEIQ